MSGVPAGGDVAAGTPTHGDGHPGEVGSYGTDGMLPLGGAGQPASVYGFGIEVGATWLVVP
jgi:hypothetical protein